MKPDNEQGWRPLRRMALIASLAAATVLSSGCATVVATAGSGVAGNLSSAIKNQDDPELVRDGAPAYLLMLDSFVEGAPDNAASHGHSTTRRRTTLVLANCHGSKLLEQG